MKNLTDLTDLTDFSMIVKWPKITKIGLNFNLIQQKTNQFNTVVSFSDFKYGHRKPI